MNYYTLLLFYIVIFFVGAIQTILGVDVINNSSIIKAETCMTKMREIASFDLSLQRKEEEIRVLFKEYEKHIMHLAEITPPETMCTSIANLVNPIMNNEIIMDAISSKSR